MSLATLPLEIIQEIVELLPRDRHLADLKTTCRNLKDGVEAHQWRIIRLYFRAVIDETVETAPDHPEFAASSKLLTRLSDEPRLCSYVRVLKVVTADDAWYANMKTYTTLLQLLPAIRELHLDPPLCRLVLPRTLPLKAVKIRFERYDPLADRRFGHQPKVTPTQLIHELASFPTLRTLQTEGGEISSRDQGFPSAPLDTDQRYFSSVEDLRLLNSSFQHPDDVSCLLLWMKGLKRLVLDLRWPPEGITRRMFLELQAHQDSLQEFVLSVRDEPYHFHNSRNDCQDCQRRRNLAVSLESWNFKGFKALKKVALPTEPFVAIDRLPLILPAALKTLQLQFSRAALDRYVDNNVSSLSINMVEDSSIDDLPNDGRSNIFDDSTYSLVHSLPSLEDVVWWFQIGSSAVLNTFHKESLQRTKQTFHNADVNFSWVQGSYVNETPMGRVMEQWS